MFIGLTGDIGAGKSTVTSLLCEAGYSVIDADGIVHDLLCQSSVTDALVQVFGEGIRDASETTHVDRKSLAARAFVDEATVAKLNDILHPLVKTVVQEKRQPNITQFYDAPLLFESGSDRFCDRCWYVTAKRTLREARLGIDKKNFLARERFLMPSIDKQERCDVVIVNDSTRAALKEAVTTQLKKGEVNG